MHITQYCKESVLCTDLTSFLIELNVVYYSSMVSIILEFIVENNNY